MGLQRPIDRSDSTSTDFPLISYVFASAVYFSVYYTNDSALAFVD